MLIDTHSHVNFNMFKSDADEVIRRSLLEETWMILVGAEYKTSRRALQFANKYEKGIYAAVGLHPTHLLEHEEEIEGEKIKMRGEEFSNEIYEQMAKMPKVVAIGEVGLDYYHIGPGEDVDNIKNKQKEVLGKQLLIARNIDKPVIIHCRQAHDDLVEFISLFKKNNKDLFKSNKPWGVIHCFSGDEDLAWKYFNLGFMISFTGLITFSKQWDNLIRKMPIDKLMVETDCPFMTPEPHRGKRNEPLYVKYVADRISQIRHLSFERMSEVTTENARRLFKI